MAHATFDGTSVTVRHQPSTDLSGTTLPSSAPPGLTVPLRPALTPADPLAPTIVEESFVRVLLTGHQGYLGTVMAPILAAAGHEVTGLDSGLFAACVLGGLDTPDVPGIAVDLRDVTVDQLAGFDAVGHMAALSNDPLGSLA